MEQAVSGLREGGSQRGGARDGAGLRCAVSMGLKAWDRWSPQMSLSLPLGICIGGLPLTMLLPLRTSLPDVRPGTVLTSPIPASAVPPCLTCVRDFPCQPQYPHLIPGDNYNWDVCERTQMCRGWGPTQ